MSYLTKSTIDLFTSHAWKYGHRRDDLHRIVFPWRRGVDFDDHSISKRHPLHQSGTELEAMLEWIVSGMDVLVVMAGMWLIDRRMMEIEIYAAADHGVPIVPVLSNGQERVPELAREKGACEPVKWRGASVRDAILSVLSPDQRRAFLARRALAQRLADQAADWTRGRAAIASLPQRSPSVFDQLGIGASFGRPAPPRPSALDPLDLLAPLPRRIGEVMPGDWANGGALEPLWSLAPTAPSPDPLWALAPTQPDPDPLWALGPTPSALAQALDPALAPRPIGGLFGALARKRGIGER